MRGRSSHGQSAPGRFTTGRRFPAVTMSAIPPRCRFRFLPKAEEPKKKSPVSHYRCYRYFFHLGFRRPALVAQLAIRTNTCVARAYTVRIAQCINVTAAQSRRVPGPVGLMRARDTLQAFVIFVPPPSDHTQAAHDHHYMVSGTPG